MRGFSLIEVLVVMAIIGMLTALIVPNVAQAQAKAKEASLKAIVHTVQAELESYQIDTSLYPEGDSVPVFDLCTEIGNRVPKNPFTGKEYESADSSGQIVYSYDIDTGEYSLTGFGQDGTTPVTVLTNT